MDDTTRRTNRPSGTRSRPPPAASTPSAPSGSRTPRRRPGSRTRRGRLYSLPRGDGFGRRDPLRQERVRGELGQLCGPEAGGQLVTIRSSSSSSGTQCAYTSLRPARADGAPILPASVSRPRTTNGHAVGAEQVPHGGALGEKLRVGEDLEHGAAVSEEDPPGECLPHGLGGHDEDSGLLHDDLVLRREPCRRCSDPGIDALPGDVDGRALGARGRPWTGRRRSRRRCSRPSPWWPCLCMHLHSLVCSLCVKSNKDFGMCQFKCLIRLQTEG